MSNVIEIVTVTLAPGVGEAQFLKACGATNSFLTSRPGFLSRRITRLEEGKYADILEWTSQSHADAAMQASMTEPCMGGLMQAIDMEKMVITHQPVVASLQA